MCQNICSDFPTKRGKREKEEKTHQKNNGPNPSQLDVKQYIDPRISVHSNQGKNKEIHAQTHHSQLLNPNTKEKVLKA